MAAAVAVELVLFQFAAESVAMNAQGARGAGLVAFLAVHYVLDETPLEFRDRLLKQNAAVR